MNISKFETLKDEELAYNVKNGINVNESFAVISDRHSGAFLKMANRWINNHVPVNFKLDQDYIFNNKNNVIFDSILSFDPSRNVKLATHITNNSMWFCSNQLKFSQKHSVADSIEDLEGFGSQQKAKDVDWEREKIEAAFSEMLKVVSESLGKKAAAIFKLRFGGEKVMKWKDVIENLKTQYNIKASNQTCLVYQKKIIEALKKEVANNPEFLEYSEILKK